MRFEVLTVLTIKSTIIWDVALWSLVEVYERFRRNILLITSLLKSLHFDPEDGGSMFLGNVSTTHGATFQKVVLYIYLILPGKY
jgi:hypothetical protein